MLKCSIKYYFFLFFLKINAELVELVISYMNLYEQ